MQAAPPSMYEGRASYGMGMWRGRAEERDSERRVTVDATQLSTLPGQGPRPRARAKRRKGGDLAVTNRLPTPILISSPPLAIRRLAARAYVRFSATAQLSLQRWPCRPRHSCARRRHSGPRRHGPPSPPRGRCGCRRLRGAGWPLPRGSPCGSRPSRPTSAVTAGG